MPARKARCRCSPWRASRPSTVGKAWIHSSTRPKSRPQSAPPRSSRRIEAPAARTRLTAP
eukprot:5494924-Lingulodinium_polyedra.AAC.1